MNRTTASLLVLLLTALSFAGAPLQAQPEDSACPVIVRDALAAAAEACADLGRNQACYGNVTLSVEAQPGVPQIEFDAPGDRAAVGDIQSIRLSSLDAEQSEWGVALLRVQANLPDTLPGQNVTVVLFGDVQVRSAPPETADQPLAVTTQLQTALRAEPDGQAEIITMLDAGQLLTADGRSADGMWLHVIVDEEAAGWVFLVLVSGVAGWQSLPVIDPAALRPMQAFYFRSGFNDAPCAQAPDSGILIQTPEEVGAVRLRINEVDIRLGSTVYVQAVPGVWMTVMVVEGQAGVAALGVEREVPAGAQVRVPLDTEGVPSRPPLRVEPYAAADVTALPLALLSRDITVAAPLSPDEVALWGVDCTLTAPGTINVRGGPGTVYTRVDALDAGESALPTGQAQGTDGLVWWRLPEGGWVRSDVVEADGNCGMLPVITDLPAPPVVSQPEPTAPAAGQGGSSRVTVRNECPGPDTVTITGPTSMTVLVGGNSAVEVELAPGTYDFVAVYNDNGCSVVEGTAYGVQVPPFNDFLACPPANFC